MGLYVHICTRTCRSLPASGSVYDIIYTHIIQPWVYMYTYEHICADPYQLLEVFIIFPDFENAFGRFGDTIVGCWHLYVCMCVCVCVCMYVCVCVCMHMFESMNLIRHLHVIMPQIEISVLSQTDTDRRRQTRTQADTDTCKSRYRYNTDPKTQ
jgi:hypothetical protein